MHTPSGSRSIALCSFLIAAVSLVIAGRAEQRPDIVWIVIEDMSAHWRCYGESLVETPQLDALAADGVRFDRATITAPVCSAARSALITGMYQTSIGAQHHRSGRGELKIHLPEPVRPVPELFQAAGYINLNQQYRALHKESAGVGKTDYNFESEANLYDGYDLAGIPADQPVFIQYQLAGGKYRGSDPGWTETNRARLEEILPRVVEPDEVVLPPYYPDHPDIRDDWAAYLNVCMVTDWEVGRVVAELKSLERWENTVLFVFTDHGISHARGKQFLYQEGVRIPLIVAGPGLGLNQVRSDLVESIDITATSLALAGIEIPDWMQGRDFFAADYGPRPFAVSARDRCDETIDHMRAVLTEDYKYIRNYLPRRPHLQPCAYKDAKSIYKALRAWQAEGLLSPLQEQLLFAPERPMEELYELGTDPWETRNLAADPAHAEELAAMRTRLEAWEESTGDLGRVPESWEMYDSDLADRLKPGHRYSPEKVETILRNIDLNKEWGH